MADQETHDGVTVGDRVEVVYDDMATGTAAGTVGVVEGFELEGEEPLANRFARIKVGKKTVRAAPAGLAVLRDEGADEG